MRESTRDAADAVRPLSPGQVDLLRALELGYLSCGRARRAAALMGVALWAAPDDPTVALDAARALLAAGRPEEALAALGPSLPPIVQRPGVRPDAWLKVCAVALWRCGRRDEAGKALRHAVAVGASHFPCSDPQGHGA